MRFVLLRCDESVETNWRTDNALKIIDAIHDAGMRAGVAVSPQTPSTAITDAIAEKSDMLLVMTVHPGRGGQKFMSECVPKVRMSFVSSGYRSDR